MKLASRRDGSRDGELYVVSRDLCRAISAKYIVPTLQKALDEWDFFQPQLASLARRLNEGRIKDEIVFDASEYMAPLPRAFQWLDGSAYLHHVELVRKARGADMPKNFLVDPLMYQGGSDTFLGACDPIPLIEEAWGADLEAEVGIITDDVPMGTRASSASQHIKLLCLINDVTLRNLVPDELAKGFGFFQSKPSSAFSPVAITPDECGAAWNGKTLCLPLCSYRNEECIGTPNAGVDMQFDFTELIAHATKTRNLGAGTIIGSGTVSNRDPVTGSSCIAEIRVKEIIARGIATTPFLHIGERIKIEMKRESGESLFGAIEQSVIRAQSRAHP